jgi:D-3-phosphoglycerate dehydrogenase
MSRPKLLILEPDGFSSLAAAKLAAVFDLGFGPFDRAALLESIADCSGIMVRLAHRIDKEVIARAGRLSFIASPTTGLNHIDVAAAEQRGVAVLSLRGEREFLDTIHATAEHTWALLLTLLRNVPAAHRSVLDGAWDRDRFRAHELFGRTLGIIGYGRIGSKVANYGRAFGMTIAACDPFVAPPPDVRRVDLNELFAISDVISVHAPFSADTSGMIGAAQMASAARRPLFINTARGELVDEEALLAALREGIFAGAALDVLCGENMPAGVMEASSDLIDFARRNPRLILTPHIGGATFESMSRTEEFITGKILHHVMVAK